MLWGIILINFGLRNKILVFLCEGPKPNSSMISGLLTPGEPLFMHLNIPHYLTKSAGPSLEGHQGCGHRLQCLFIN